VRFINFVSRYFSAQNRSFLLVYIGLNADAFHLSSVLRYLHLLGVNNFADVSEVLAASIVK
jgi:hypothetical protein